jgi:PAS domain-containing protein
MRLTFSRVRPATVLIVLLAILQAALALLGGDPLIVVLRWAALALTAGLGFTLLLEARRRAHRRRALEKLRQLVAAPGTPVPLQALVASALDLIPTAAGCAIHLADEQGRAQYAQAQATAGQRQPLVRASITSDAPRIIATSPMPAPALAQRALQERRSLRATDLAPGAALASGIATGGIAPLLAVPICPGDEPLGVLVISASAKRLLSTEDEAAAALVALVAGLLLREQRLREALQTETPHANLILNAITDALVVLDYEDRVVLHNPALAAILGPNLAGLKGVKLQVRSTDDRIQRLAYLVGDTTLQTPSQRHITIDEPIHAVLDVEIAPVRDHAGRWLRIVTMHDVTATSDALDAQTNLLRSTAHGLQAPLAALSAGPANQGLVQPARQLDRLRQDLLAVAEPLDNLAQSALPTVSWKELLARLENDLPRPIARRLQVHSHPALEAQQVPDRWLDHLLLTLIEETGRRSAEGLLSLDIEGKPGEMVFSVRSASGEAPEGSAENSLGFGASQTTLSLHVARRLAEALGGYLWQASDAGALRYQLILPTARRRR